MRKTSVQIAGLIAVFVALATAPVICGQAWAQSQDLIALEQRISALQDAGKYAEATPLAEQFVRQVETQYGEWHTNTAVAVNKLATLYEDQRRSKEAERNYLRSLAIRERAVGSAHPAVASGLNNLAAFYQSQGRLARF